MIVVENCKKKEALALITRSIANIYNTIIQYEGMCTIIDKPYIVSGNAYDIEKKIQKLNDTSAANLCKKQK